jgi:CelD/BcsL family acetyltransferase involved in cellulose biosynthesis
VKIEIHDSLEAVGPTAWDTLQAGSRLRSPFLAWTWQSEWVTAFGRGRRLELRRVTDGTGQLVALLPLIETAPGRLMLTGGSDVSDYLDLIALGEREEEAWTALLAARATDRSVWELHSVPAASPTVTAVPSLAAATGLTVTSVVEERCPVLQLPDTWETYLASLSSKHRHELSRKIRRFEREEPSGRITIETTPTGVAARLDDFLDLHRQSRVGKVRFMDERMEGFFRRVIVALAAQGAARLSFLDTPAGPIAAFVTLEWDDTVGLYNSGFRPDCAPLSPGLVLLAGLVRDALERGRRCFDFLRGEERYKYEFGPVPEAVHAVTLEGRS